jgi:hypothetical protein
MLTNIVDLEVSSMPVHVAVQDHVNSTDIPLDIYYFHVKGEAYYCLMVSYKRVHSFE